MVYVLIGLIALVAIEALFIIPDRIPVIRKRVKK